MAGYVWVHQCKCTGRITSMVVMSIADDLQSHMLVSTWLYTWFAGITQTFACTPWEVRIERSIPNGEPLGLCGSFHPQVIHPPPIWVGSKTICALKVLYTIPIPMSSGAPSTRDASKLPNLWDWDGAKSRALARIELSIIKCMCDVALVLGLTTASSIWTGRHVLSRQVDPQGALAWAEGHVVETKLPMSLCFYVVDPPAIVPWDK